MKKIILAIVLLVILLVGAGASWAYFKFLYTKPLTKAELAELTPDWDKATGGNWSPWFVEADGTTVWNPAASYNAWLATVPEGDKAWPVMAEAFSEYKPLLLDNEVYGDFAGSLPTDPERWARLKLVLGADESDALLERLLVAFNRPVLGAGWSDVWDPYEHAAMAALRQRDPEAFDPGPLEFDPDANVAMMDMKMHWLGRQQKLTRFVSSKAALELENGDSERFVSSMEGLLKSSDLSREIPTLIASLVEAGVESVAIRTIDWGVNNHLDRFDEPQLARLLQAIAEHADAQIVWEGEALMFHDSLRRLCTKSGRLSSIAISNYQSNFGSQLGPPVNLKDSQLHPSTQGVLYVLDRMLSSTAANSRIPWDSSSISADELLAQEQDKLNARTSLMLDILAPATGIAADRFREHAQEVLGARLGLAALRHYKRHGEYAESLDEIDNELLGFDPIDAFTGQPLHYILTKDGPVVYSVGEDYADDGGVQLWIKKTGPNEEPYFVKDRVRWLTPEEAESIYADPKETRGDWVLFPMPVNDPEPMEDEESDWDD